MALIMNVTYYYEQVHIDKIKSIWFWINIFFD